MGFCSEVGQKASSLTLDDLPENTRRWAKTSILDTIAVAFAGCREPGLQILESVVGKSRAAGPCLIFGSDQRVSAPDAALMNGMSAHVLDFDTSNDTFEGHPSVQLLPAVFAVAEEVKASGRDLLVAYVAGFEVQALLAKATQPKLVGKGWFPTASLGVFGAAAAACHLLKMSADETAKAISACAMLACGTLAHAGSMMKPFASGHAARNGVLVALLVKEGFTAAPDAVEDRRGFLNLFADGGTRKVEDVLATWGSPFDVDETSIGIKRYPCCGIIHSSLDVLTKLMKDEGLTGDNVASVDVALITQRLHHINRPNPTSPIEGKFSIQYCLASLLRHGAVNLGTFTDAAIHDPATRALMGLITAGVHADIKPNARRQEGGTEIVLTTRDGRRLKAGAAKALGRVPGEPLPDSIVDAKFLDCTSLILAPVQAQRALGMLRGLERVTSVSEISEALASRSSSSKSSFGSGQGNGIEQRSASV